jgi:FAD/FMN-containing dehydrogenase/ribosomal protein S18 acetylase RimI-like enzyme/SAM-dependent methyltransferase
MIATTESSAVFLPAEPACAEAVARLIYDSSHELFDLIFATRQGAESALTVLLSMPRGQFGYQFATVLKIDNEIVGVELGYDGSQLSAQQVPGLINMLRAMPLVRLPHLIGKVSRALSGYVPPPSADAYYVNNIAVDSKCRGLGLGKQLLEHVVETARVGGYRSVELDVTDVNVRAIRFYQHLGFSVVSTSGTEAVRAQYGLPKLLRMRYLISHERGFSFDNYGHANSTTLVNDVSRLYPVLVDEVYAPGTVAQLQEMLRTTSKPVSIGGGRFSMGGQSAHPGTLHIDMRGLNRIIDVNAEERLIRVQAGARWKDIQKVISDYGLSIKIMQTYSNFTVGGSISVNCHGRYVGLGPMILSVRSVSLVLQDGELIQASSGHNADIFHATVGGYGALGVIVEAELELAENTRIERLSRKMDIGEYPYFFAHTVRNNECAVFHNADMVPPDFRKVRAVTWQTTSKPVNRKVPRAGRRLYLAEKYMLWSITETPAGHWWRENVYEPLLYLRSKITLRNDEADYDVAELEPLSRDRKTYVLQEYFVPVDRLARFTEPMTRILNRHGVMVVNISIRHSHADPGSFLAWAREEVFALVLYYKQGTSRGDGERVAVWTRELIDAVLACDGTYYLPYQPHARHDQFHRSYPRARELFKLKDKLDPEYRFRNCLWEKYYRRSADKAIFVGKKTTGSEFLTVYGKLDTRDAFYRFLQTIYHLYPEHEFHRLIMDACNRYDDDEAIYMEVANRLPEIKPALSELTHALPALAKQKQEMKRQTTKILSGRKLFDGYLEIGSTGRYVKMLERSLGITGPIYLTNDTIVDNSLPEIMERGGIRKVGRFFRLDDYAPVRNDLISDESLDLVSCYIGLHHCPREKLDGYITSIHRLLRPGGCFVLRDHDAGTEEMRTFCSLVHTVFNAGLGVSWETDRQELRLFEGITFWADAVTRHGFIDTGKRLLQDNDPSLNTLLCFVKN